MAKLVGAAFVGLFAFLMLVSCSLNKPPKDDRVLTESELHKSHIENNKKLFEIVMTQGSRISELEEQLRCRDKAIQDLSKTNTRIVGILEAHNARLGKLEK